MLFWLKKTVSFWLMPLPFCLVLLVAGLWFLRNSRRPRLGRGLVGTGVLLLLLFSNGFVSLRLVQPLESRYPAAPEFRSDATVPAAFARCRYVVVLGSGHADVADLPATSKLSSHGLARLAEGVRLLRALPAAKLIVTGPGDPGQPTHAAVLAQAAIALGVSADRIVKIEHARDTEDEVNAVHLLVGDAPLALVTSAWHLPRAVALAQRAGLDTLPCPAGYLGKSGPGGRWSGLSWSPESLERSSWALRERLGNLWLWLRGK